MSESDNIEQGDKQERLPWRWQRVKLATVDRLTKTQSEADSSPAQRDLAAEAAHVARRRWLRSQ
jgi:hypothetical protein